MKAQPKASHFIDGDYVDDVAGTPFESVYPATGEVIAPAGKKITPRMVKEWQDKGDITEVLVPFDAIVGRFAARDIINEDTGLIWAEAGDEEMIGQRLAQARADVLLLAPTMAWPPERIAALAADSGLPVVLACGHDLDHVGDPRQLRRPRSRLPVPGAFAGGEPRPAPPDAGR